MMRQLVAACSLVVLLSSHGSADQADARKCDIQSGACVMQTTSGMEISLSITPRPVRSMEDLEFLVIAVRKGRPVAGAAIVLDLSMPGMYMGVNQPKLKEDRDGSYRGRGILPRCASGQRTWMASISVNSGSMVDQAAVLFEVK